MEDNATEKPKRKRAPRKAAPKVDRARKTLIAAVSAMLIAGVDLFMTLRYGLKFF